MSVRAVGVATLVALSATVAVAQTPSSPIVEVYGGECVAHSACTVDVTGTVAVFAMGGGAGGGDVEGGGSGVAGASFVTLYEETTDVVVGAGGAAYIPGPAWNAGVQPTRGGSSSIGDFEVVGGGSTNDWPMIHGGSGGGAGGYSRAPIPYAPPGARLLGWHTNDLFAVSFFFAGTN